MTTYTVSIAPTRDATSSVASVYKGDDYNAAFDAAVQARGHLEWRKKWIKFEDGDLGIIKWAEIL